MPIDWSQELTGRGDVAPSAAGFGIEGGRSSRMFVLSEEDGTKVTAGTIHDAIIEVLGDVAPKGDGRLARSLPAADPEYPWLFASAIPEIVGFGHKDGDGNAGGAVAVDPGFQFEAPPIVDEYWSYLKRRVKIDFTPRPYAVLNDESVSVDEHEWYLDDDDGQVSPRRDAYAREWDRFVAYEEQTNTQVVSASHGQLVFRVADGFTPDRQVATGFPNTRVQMTSCKYVWFQIPLSYVEHANSPLKLFAGTINQQAWDGWEAGSLLFLGANVLRRYTPPVPAWYEDPWSDAVIYSNERLADVELLFEYTSRVPDPDAPPPEPVNRSWKASGHNCFPWFQDLKNYYVTASDPNEDPNNPDETLWRPTFKSRPFQLLFTDPDTLDDLPPL